MSGFKINVAAITDIRLGLEPVVSPICTMFPHNWCELITAGRTWETVPFAWNPNPQEPDYYLHSLRSFPRTIRGTLIQRLPEIF